MPTWRYTIEELDGEGAVLYKSGSTRYPDYESALKAGAAEAERRITEGNTGPRTRTLRYQAFDADLNERFPGATAIL